MKKLIPLLLLMTFYLGVNAQTDYYWYKGNKISLTKVSNKKFIVFNESQDTVKLKKTIKTPKAKVEKYSDLYLSEIIKYKKKRKNNKKWAVLVEDNIANKKLTKDDQILYEANFYKTQQGIEAGLSHLFYVWGQ